MPWPWTPLEVSVSRSLMYGGTELLVRSRRKSQGRRSVHLAALTNTGTPDRKLCFLSVFRKLWGLLMVVTKGRGKAAVLVWRS